MMETIAGFAAKLPTAAWVAIGVVLLPVTVVFSAVSTKILWGLWPVPLCIGIAGWGIWRLGMEWFWIVAIGIMAGIILAWLWQRTRLYLAGDRFLDRIMMLGD